jgi:glycosyltransferase involved in cell wall biosynthesis
MRILSITAGAANMYCGSCLRDNALAAELRRLGHDVTLLPLYTPTRTDEPNVSEPRVFFGGVSVYLEQRVPALRRLPAWLDALWDRPAVIRALAARSARTDPRVLGELTVSMLRGDAGYQSKEVGKLLDWLRREPPFDIVVLPNALLIALARPLARELAAPVVCTLQGEDLFLDGLRDDARRAALGLIRSHVPAIRRFVAVSDYYADFMSRYLEIPRGTIDVVPLGISVDGYRRAPLARDPFTIGYFARIDPAKGLHRLCAVYRHLRQALGLPPSRLLAAGFLGAEHRGYLADCQRRMHEWGLGDEFAYAGELDRDQKIAFMSALDVLSVPTPYAEPKGLFLLEAMACGVPVVQPRHGAYPEILERTGGGLLVEDTEVAIAEGLLALWRVPDRAAELGRRGAAGLRAHYTAEAMARRALDVYAGVIAGADRRAARTDRAEAAAGP